MASCAARSRRKRALKRVALCLMFQTRECVEIYKIPREIGGRIVYNANRHARAPSPCCQCRSGNRPYRIERARRAPARSGAQSSPQPQRHGQHQGARAEVKTRLTGLAGRRSSRFYTISGRRICGALKALAIGCFAGVTAAPIAAALAVSAAASYMSGESYCCEWNWVR
jgi:hypothetical protein